MNYKRLFILVEGNDDERFFKNILESKFNKKFDFVEIIKYATTKKEKINNFINSIQAMGADYMFVADINNCPCITAEKQKIQKKYKNINSNKIIVVIKEIESWYAAGCLKFRMCLSNNTNEITKNQFINLIPKKFDSKIDFMAEILKNFSIEEAKKKNISFDYLIKKYKLDDI
ncbi:MAG TPA: hypothetical protein PLW61_02300 [Caldisericia bacterium]|nr:hypothetical protein [Caldisericia bacterium]HPB33576.1 hypothetical protein [Caldisericia bacterium]HQL65934.1 hypothetical protein [Caldisericia bacterium]HQN48664.1 hypothetical protein [Caldisericia bacterium]HQP00181.1 hypothetical protein [Caldisericia bacterium]